jgi:hypothetical protein
MANVQKNKGAVVVSSSPVTVYENFNFAEHKGYFFFDNFASGDEFNYKVEVVNLQVNAYRVITSKNVDYAKLQSFTEKGIEMIPRIADQIRITFQKVGGNDRTVEYTMYAILIT